MLVEKKGSTMEDESARYGWEDESESDDSDDSDDFEIQQESSNDSGENGNYVTVTNSYNSNEVNPKPTSKTSQKLSANTKKISPIKDTNIGDCN